MLNLIEIWKFHILPLLGLKILKINEFRSVCKEFSNYISANKALHIKVPSKKYPTLKDAYDAIYNIYENKRVKKLPQIWLDSGTHINEIPKIKLPITIKGVGFHTIVSPGIKIKIDNFYPVTKFIIKNITIKGNNDSEKFNPCEGIDYSGKSKLKITHCNILNCNYSGIRGYNSYIHAYKLDIQKCTTGIHIWGSSKFHIENTHVHHNKNGIVIGSIKLPITNYITNLVCHDNLENGLGVGGWNEYGINPIVELSGHKTNIYNNNTINHKYCSGIETDYDGKIVISNLSRNVSNNNKQHDYYKQDNRSKIIFA